jgi:hypothetical protein
MTDARPEADVTTTSRPVTRASVTELGPLFKMVLMLVITATTVLFVVNLILALAIESPTENQQNLIERVELGWWMGFSGLVGLVSGKLMP